MPNNSWSQISSGCGKLGIIKRVGTWFGVSQQTHCRLECPPPVIEGKGGLPSLKEKVDYHSDTHIATSYRKYLRD